MGDHCDLSVFVDKQVRDLDTILDQFASPNASIIIFVDAAIYRPMKHIQQSTSPKNQSRVVGLFSIKDHGVYPCAQHVIYFLRTDVEHLRSFVIHLLSYTQQYPKAKPSVFFAPQKSVMAEQLLESDFKLSQLFPELIFGEYNLDITKLEEDFMIMSQPYIYRNLFCKQDITSLTWISQLLVKLQTSCYGMIPSVKGKGKMSSRIVAMMKAMQAKLDEEFLLEIPSEVSNLFIIDRSIDPITPLMTQLTYEGLIDEMYGINTCEVSFPFSVSEGNVGDKSNTAVLLNNEDKMFAEIRDKNFTNVGTCLYQKSVWVKQQYERRKEVHQLKELKEFMKGLPEMQEIHRQIAIHTSVATEIGKRTQSFGFRRRIQTEQSIIQQLNEKESLTFIEDLIHQKEPLSSVLRLLSLYSLVNGGLKTKEYDFFKEAMMLSYGIPDVISAFSALEEAGLLSKYEGKATYPAIRKMLHTWNSALNEQQPNDIAYAYSGYASLLVRTVEAMLDGPGSSSILTALPGETKELFTPIEMTGSTRTTIVFVVGGITAAEVSSFRFLQDQLAKAGRAERFLLMSTDMTNGKKLISSLLS